MEKPESNCLLAVGVGRSEKRGGGERSFWDCAALTTLLFRSKPKKNHTTKNTHHTPGLRVFPRLVQHWAMLGRKKRQDGGSEKRAKSCFGGTLLCAKVQ